MITQNKNTLNICDMLHITVHMCFTTREQAVRRRWPASYSSHSVDRLLWRRVYFFPLQPRGAHIWQQTDTNVYEDGFLVEKVQQPIHVQPTRVGSAVETRVPTLDVVVVCSGCLNADHALAPAASEGHRVAGWCARTSAQSKQVVQRRSSQTVVCRSGCNAW